MHTSISDEDLTFSRSALQSRTAELHTESNLRRHHQSGKDEENDHGTH